MRGARPPGQGRRPVRRVVVRSGGGAYERRRSQHWAVRVPGAVVGGAREDEHAEAAASVRRHGDRGCRACVTDAWRIAPGTSGETTSVPMARVPAARSTLTHTSGACRSTGGGTLPGSAGMHAGRAQYAARARHHADASTGTPPGTSSPCAADPFRATRIRGPLAARCAAQCAGSPTAWWSRVRAACARPQFNRATPRRSTGGWASA